MLSLGGVNLLTGMGRKNGTATLEAMLRMAASEEVELQVEGGAALVL
jgi:hypothetical protein